jgi:O-antigen ligase
VTVAAVWCGGYALVERWWGTPVAWGAATSRLGGPFGSAAYLGAALCLLVPITAGVALDRAEQPGWRAAGAFGVATGVVALVGSGTRGAWLGVVLAVGALVIAGRRPSRRTWAAAGALAVVALAVVGTRLDDVVDRSTPVASRIDEWSMAGRAVVERPLLGAGPEGYRTVVADVVSADYERTYGREVLPDRAHDGVLDVAVTGGLPAMVAHLALVAWALGAAWRALRERDARRVGLGVAVIAYVAQQAFLFPLAELDPVLWLAAGALLTTGNGLHTPPARHRRRWPAVAAACGALALFATGALGVAADRAAADATSRAGDAATVAARRAV